MGSVWGLCRPGVPIAELEADFWGGKVFSAPGTKETTQGEDRQTGEGGTVLRMELWGT